MTGVPDQINPQYSLPFLFKVIKVSAFKVVVKIKVGYLSKAESLILLWKIKKYRFIPQRVNWPKT